MNADDKEYSDFLNIMFRVFTPEEIKNAADDAQKAIRNEEADDLGHA